MDGKVLPTINYYYNDISTRKRYSTGIFYTSIGFSAEFLDSLRQMIDTESCTLYWAALEQILAKSQPEKWETKGRLAGCLGWINMETSKTKARKVRGK